MEIIKEVIDYESTLRRNLLRSKGSRMRHGEKLSKNLSSFKPSLHLSQTRRRSNLEGDGSLEYGWHHKIFHFEIRGQLCIPVSIDHWASKDNSLEMQL